MDNSFFWGMNKVDTFQTLGVILALLGSGFNLYKYLIYQRLRMKIVVCNIQRLENKAIVFELIITNPSNVPFAIADMYLKYKNDTIQPVSPPITLINSSDRRYIFSKYNTNCKFSTVKNIKAKTHVISTGEQLNLSIGFLLSEENKQLSKYKLHLQTTLFQKVICQKKKFLKSSR